MEETKRLDEENKRIELEKFNRTDETKRYIAELNAETARIQKEQGDTGLENDDDFERFEEELGIKKQALSNDMLKHDDNMSMKAKELDIKRSQATKASQTKK